MIKSFITKHFLIKTSYINGESHRLKSSCSLSCFKKADQNKSILNSKKKLALRQTGSRKIDFYLKKTRSRLKVDKKIFSLKVYLKKRIINFTNSFLS